jgi:hypothetical protein
VETLESTETRIIVFGERARQEWYTHNEIFLRAEIAPTVSGELRPPLSISGTAKRDRIFSVALMKPDWLDFHSLSHPSVGVCIAHRERTHLGMLGPIKSGVTRCPAKVSLRAVPPEDGSLYDRPDPRRYQTPTLMHLLDSNVYLSGCGCKLSSAQCVCGSVVDAPWSPSNPGDRRQRRLGRLEGADAGLDVALAGPPPGWGHQQIGYLRTFLGWAYLAYRESMQILW